MAKKFGDSAPSGQGKTTVRFADGKLFVNDQEIPLTSPAGMKEGVIQEEMPAEELEGEAEEPAQQ